MPGVALVVRAGHDFSVETFDLPAAGDSAGSLVADDRDLCVEVAVIEVDVDPYLCSHKSKQVVCTAGWGH